MDVDTYLQNYLLLIEDELKDALSSRRTLSQYYGMMQYHMGWLDEHLVPAQAQKGKRLRPLLCLLVCDAVGGQVKQALPAAIAIEILHNFTLVHDDIEDDSAMRRHRTTVWKLWGIAHGINCGDGMFALSMLKLSELPKQGVPLQHALNAQYFLSATCLALTEGQYMDMAFETQMDVDLNSSPKPGQRDCPYSLPGRAIPKQHHSHSLYKNQCPYSGIYP